MRVRIRATFLLYLATLALLASPEACLGAVCALAVHEAGHLLAARALGARFAQMELTPFGGVISGAPGAQFPGGPRGALIALAGPLGNALALAALLSMPVRGMLGDPLARQLALPNAVMLAFNLLPALPLDGGQIVFCLFRFALGASRLIALLCALGACLGAGMIALCGAGLWRYGLLNVSLLLVGAYLIASAARCREAMLLQNLYSVVRERRERPSAARRLTLYAVPEDAPLYSLLPLIEHSDAAGFVVATQAGERAFGEAAALGALLHESALSVGEFAKSAGQKLDSATKVCVFP